MKQVVILTVLFFLVSGCTKWGKNVTIKGRVLNPVTGAGIADVRVFMYRGTLDIPGDFKIVKETYTGSDGSFELNKLGLSGYYVKCDVSGDYYSVGWEKKEGVPLFDQYTMSPKKGKIMHADYYAVPYGNLILDIHNVNCQGTTDTMYFRKKWLGYSEFEGAYSTPRIGCYTYTSPSSFKIPMGKYVYETKVIRSGIITYVYDTIFVPQTGVVTLGIDY